MGKTSPPTQDKHMKQKVSTFLASSKFKWMQKIGAATIDQALFAGSNFLTNVLLGRWMEPDEYGAFVVAYAWFLLLLNFYDALLIEPMSLYGSGKYKDKLNGYLGMMYIGHAGITGVIALMLALGALGAFVFDSELMGMAILGTAVASPLILMRWLTRQPFYITGQPQKSVYGGIIYSVVLVSSIGLLQLTGSLNAFSGVIALGIASFISSMAMTIIFIKPEFKTGDADLTTKKIVADHWAYGLWSTSTRMLSWLAGNFGILFIPLVVGLEGTAALRATLNLTMPLFMINAAIISLLVPNFVRTFEREGKDGLDRRVRLIAMMATGFTVTYALAVILLGEWAINLIYDGKYNDFANLEFIIAIALLPIVTTVSQIFNAAMRAMNEVRYVFFMRIYPTIMVVVLDIIFVSAWGVIGVPVESVLTALMVLASYYWLYMRFLPAQVEKAKNNPEPDLDISEPIGETE